MAASLAGARAEVASSAVRASLARAASSALRYTSGQSSAVRAALA